MDLKEQLANSKSEADKKSLKLEKLSWKYKSFIEKMKAAHEIEETKRKNEMLEK